LASAQSGRSKTLHATRTSRPPHIDGRLDDPVWLQAPTDGRFVQNFPDEGKPPSQRTELRVLYDDDALYIGVRCFDDHPKEIVERLTRRDRDTAADKITVDIDSKNDRSTAYHFDLNVSGVLADGVRFNDTDYNPDWDGLWAGASSRDAQGWSAELRIPLRTLRYDGRTSEFGLQVRRSVQRRQEVDEWAPIPRTARGEVSYYGSLAGLDGLAPRRLFQLAPYVAGRLTLLSHQPPLDGLYPAGSMGADLKVGITSALTLDATFNPDFGQVEADQVILNLSTFEIQFPEKRPFFLEGAEMFATPLQQFYSRRIGRSPDAPALSPTEQLASPLANAGQIWLAAKLTGLIGKRFSIAALDALTAAQTADVQDNQTQAHRTRLVDPLANFAVLRLKREVLSSSYVGATLTAVNRFEPGNAIAPDPGLACPDGTTPAAGRCTHDAYTAGFDTALRTADGEWGGRAHVVGSWVVNGPSRAIADGNVIGPGDAGLGVFAEVGRYGGKHWLFALNYQTMSPKLELNDAGFLQRANLHHWHGNLTLRTKTPHGALLEGDITLWAFVEHTWDGADTQRYFEVDFHAYFRNFFSLYAQCGGNLNHQDDRETRDGAFLERAGTWYCGAFGNTDRRKRAIFSIWAGIGSTERGLTIDSNAQLSLRVIAPLEIDIIPRGSWTYGDPRWFDTVYNSDGSRTYFFGDLDSREFDVTLRATWAFTPTLTLQGYAQLFVASGHYGPLLSIVASGDHPLLPLSGFQPAGNPPYGSPDFREGTINVNLVLRWEYQPGATVMGVWTHSSGQNPFELSTEGPGRLRLRPFRDGPATDVFLLKVSALWG
jgi:hypothetical protein